jgi:lipopolysaccharide/colanic/teichoic acid biosynthesis glycosyltransferase
MYRIFGKRLFDLLLATVGLIAAAPLFLLLPVVIKMNSAGPVFFVQQRMGKGGRLFSLIKFRSMTVKTANDGKDFEPGFGPRITASGKVLRKLKLDEVPQLINVLKGEMSMVGPRPEVKKYARFYAGKYADVLSVRPGLTDPASIKYRNEETIFSSCSDPEKIYATRVLPDKLEIALRYVREGMDFKNDLSILAQTVLAVLKPGDRPDFASQK